MAFAASGCGARGGSKGRLSETKAGPSVNQGGQQGGQSSLHVRHGSRGRVAEVQLIELVTGQGLGDRQQAQALTVQV